LDKQAVILCTGPKTLPSEQKPWGSNSPVQNVDYPIYKNCISTLVIVAYQIPNYTDTSNYDPKNCFIFDVQDNCWDNTIGFGVDVNGFCPFISDLGKGSY